MTQCPIFTLLQNENNSCYLDSILFAMLHDPKSPTCRFLTKLNPKQDTPNVQRIMAELNTIAATFQTKTRHSLAPLRKLLQKSQHGSINWTHEQIEPLDFLIFIQDIFKVRNCLQFREEVRSENKVVTSHTIRSPFVDIVNGTSPVNLRNIYPIRVSKETFDSPLWRHKYKERIETRTLLSCSKFLMVHVTRLSDGATKSTEKVTPLSKITMAKEITLRAIIVHHGSSNGGHYTCLYKCGRKWYEFDDMESGPHTIVKDVKRDYYLKNATDFIYW